MRLRAERAGYIAVPAGPRRAHRRTVVEQHRLPERPAPPSGGVFWSEHELLSFSSRAKPRLTHGGGWTTPHRGRPRAGARPRSRKWPPLSQVARSRSSTGASLVSGMSIPVVRGEAFCLPPATAADARAPPRRKGSARAGGREPIAASGGSDRLVRSQLSRLLGRSARPRVLPLDGPSLSVALTPRGSDVIVYYWGHGCVDCRALAPSIERLADEQPDITVVALDVKRSPRSAADYGVERLPTVIRVRDAEPIAVAVGALPYDVLVDHLGRPRASGRPVRPPGSTA